MTEPTKQTAVFGGGCFWCTEAVFQRLKGVQAVESGYAGGSMDNPSYEDVCSGQTGHAEVNKIEFNPNEISYQKLLEVFFDIHDPTTLNRQGNDIGTQYRSVIFYSNDEQKKVAEEFIQQMKDSKQFSREIVTQLEPLKAFYKAESYHQNYYNKNSYVPYCSLIISPKLKHFEQKYKDLLKEER